MRLFLVGLVITFVGLSMAGCKEVTAWVVGETVQAGKEVTTGIVEGVEEGRKAGESVDGATIVTSLAELQANGTVSVREVRGGPAGSEVVLAFENTTDKPLRIGGVELIALDSDGFTLRPTGAVDGLTVPAKAKDQVVVAFAEPAEKIKTVRVWGLDLPTPPPTPAPQ